MKRHDSIDKILAITGRAAAKAEKELEKEEPDILVYDGAQWQPMGGGDPPPTPGEGPWTAEETVGLLLLIAFVLFCLLCLSGIVYVVLYYGFGVGR